MRWEIGVIACCAIMAFPMPNAGASGGKAPDAVPGSALLQQDFNVSDALSFRNPAREFLPETWFHFIGGNVSTQGITADLEAIAGAGIQGVQLFHGQFGGPWPGVDRQIKCLSEPWDGAVRHAAEECRRLGLRFSMQNCPGWAMSGGPWITPDKAMRHLVWSRSEVTGGSDVQIHLPKPQPSQEDWRDYREVTTMAFPMPDGDTSMALTPASIQSNRGDLPWSKCFQSEKDARITLEPGKEPVWVEASFAEPTTILTIEFPPIQSFNHQWCYLPGVTITVEAVLPDGKRVAAKQEVPRSNWQDNTPFSLACAEIPAKTYRITIENKHSMSFPFIRLFTGARLNNWESQAAFCLRSLDRTPPPPQSKTAWIDPALIIDLSDKVDAEGTLRWQAPPGRWTVLRWGHVNTGKRNGPAPPEATGWECDKLSPAGADAHFAGYIGRLSGASGPAGGGLMQGMVLDSWECETQTWTPGLDRQFAQLRGYPLQPWFPALAGYVVGNPETTTRFLRDWRVTINDLLVKNFFGRMAELGKRNGLAISFETASGDVFPGDILEYYKHADVPMCEFWRPRMEAFVGSFDFKPVKPCVSAARIYGKPRVAAEAFTSFDLSWKEHPAMLKHIADMHFAEGVTHLVFHTYTHNPRTDFLPPGTAFGSNIGTPFLRGQTWWQNMPGFTAYLARCGYLLERGQPVSDVLWYLGDEQDHKPRQDAPFPAGYRYDYCNPDALLNRLSVRDGKIVTPEGLSYRVIWLPDCRRMLPETVERLLELVKKGAILAGDRPTGLATLTGGAAAENRFQTAVAALWGSDNASAASDKKRRRCGKGTVFSGSALAEALKHLGTTPDLEGEGVVWTHRQTDGADWYFVAAPEQGFHGTLRFRAVGAVELWDPMTGETTSAGMVRREGATSLVALDIPPSGSVFVVFQTHKRQPIGSVVRIEQDGSVVADAGTISAKPASAAFPPCEVISGGKHLLAWEPGVYRAIRASGAVATWEIRDARQIPLDKGWTLHFPAGWGAPDLLRLDSLRSWTELDLPAEARAFSGTAVYTTEFTLDPSAVGGRIDLDLGRVEAIARVSLNGKPAGMAWAPPYRLDLTPLAKPGSNRLTIEVTSVWFNRLAYDAGLDEKDRKTWTIAGPAKGSPPIPAGLLGPVFVRIGQYAR